LCSVGWQQVFVLSRLAERKANNNVTEGVTVDDIEIFEMEIKVIILSVSGSKVEI
jgi:hypothetical protein